MKRSSIGRQRGVAALAVVVVLLFAMTLVAFFSQRGVLFEQRTSANQYRSTLAFEAAEAGLEWATAMLNDARRIDAACRPQADQPTSFRARYAPPGTDGALLPAAGLRPGCSFDSGALACSCPLAGAPTGLQENSPGFTVEFAAVAGDPHSLRVVSRGCTDRGSQCVPGASHEADATATLQVLLKLRPLLRATPVAALTTGGDVQLAGGSRIANTDLDSQGYVIVAAGDVTLAADVGLTTVPGSPPANAVVQRDPPLLQLAAADASGDTFFAAFFGSTLEQFRDAPTTKHIGGCSGAACGTALLAAHAEGYRSFFVEGELPLDGAGWPGGSIGTPEQPLAVVVMQPLRFDGGVPAHGLFYANAADWDLGGAVDLRGALIARGRFRSAAGGSIRYDAGVLRRLRLSSGVFARVPGSWLDSRCAQVDPSQTCDFSP